jgi:hypothetical protein
MTVTPHRHSCKQQNLPDPKSNRFPHKLSLKRTARREYSQRRMNQLEACAKVESQIEYPEISLWRN